MTSKINPLVSVVVPVYNVSNYLNKCINSIINQTYDNIEIIIVDDGSTDNSGIMCDVYSTEESRIKVIHQLNQGLSAARNTGIDVCRGEYIMFVDSDDWVSENIIEILLNDILKYNLKLSISDLKRVADAHNVTKCELTDQSPHLIDRNSAISKMLLGQWWSANSKLYHKSIFETLRFPVGRTNEDYAIMYKVFEQCDTISYNKNKLYYYLIRPGSICTLTLNIHKFDEVFNAVDVVNYVKGRDVNHLMQAEFNVGASLIKMIMSIYEDKTESFYYMLPELNKILNQNFKSLAKNQYMPFKQKLFLFSLRYSGKNINTLMTKIYNQYKTNKLQSTISKKRAREIV